MLNSCSLSSLYIVLPAIASWAFLLVSVAIYRDRAHLYERAVSRLLSEKFAEDKALKTAEEIKDIKERERARVHYKEKAREAAKHLKKADGTLYTIGDCAASLQANWARLLHLAEGAGIDASVIDAMEVADTHMRAAIFKIAMEEKQ